MDDSLGRFLERAALPPGWHILHEPVVESTQELARAAAARGWPSRTVFSADSQTVGRGRRGRSWIAPPRSGLLVSLLLREHAASPVDFTVLAAVALCETIEALLKLDPVIKWPNDVLVNGRKVAGILTEASDASGGYVVVGIGVNVNWGAARPEGVPQEATCLELQAGYPVHRGELLVVLIERLGTWLALAPGERHSALWRAWHGRLWRHGETVRVLDVGRTLEGRLIGVDPDGALLLESVDGAPVRIIDGELILEPPGT